MVIYSDLAKALQEFDGKSIDLKSDRWNQVYTSR